MLKTRKRAESNTMQSLPLVWDDKPHEGRKSTVTLQSSMQSKQNGHDETAEDAVNALLGINDEANAAAQPQAKIGHQPPAPPQKPPKPPPQEEPEEQEDNVSEEPEILEINDNESLGDSLTKLRGALGCSLQDLANKTKIPIQKIKALEEGNYDEISNINMGADYVRKLCIEYVMPADKYVLKFKEEYSAYSHNEDSSASKPPQPPPSIEIAKQRFISIPSLLIGTLILVLVLFVLGGLARLYFRTNVEKSKTNLTELAPVNRGTMSVLPMPEDQ